MSLADQFDYQADACRRLGSPLYGDLLESALADLEAGGVVAEVLAGNGEWRGPDAVALRLLGSVHRLVLEGRADGLAAYYPSVGGVWEAAAGWVAFRQVLVEQPDEVRSWLARPPQTNEVGRSAALYGGLLHLPRHLPLRLVEIGCSAGLNLRADRFAYTDLIGNVFGDPRSPVRLDGAFGGRLLTDWPDLQVAQRLGCDLDPIDAATPEGRLTLTAYVWPDQLPRLERLRSAFVVAESVPVGVRRQGGLELVRDLELVEGTTTVLWHSVMWQYLPKADQHAIRDRIEELAEQATDTRWFAHLRLEPEREPGRDLEFLVSLRSWPDGTDRVIGTSRPHGVPTDWTA